MSASGGRNEVVDLTTDSDADEEPVSFDATYGPSWLKVPIPGSTILRPSFTAPSTRPTNAHVPLPRSAPHTPYTNTNGTHRRTQNEVVSPTGSGFPCNATSPIYAPQQAVIEGISVPTTADWYDSAADGQSSARPEKRRKTSLYADVHSANVNNPATVSISDTNFVQPQANGLPLLHYGYRPQAQTSPTLRQLPEKATYSNLANRVPSVRDMNEALKTNGSTLPLMRDVVPSEPRPLSIGRTLYEDNTSSTNGADQIRPLQGPTTPLAQAPPASIKKPRSVESSEHGYSMSGFNTLQSSKQVNGVSHHAVPEPMKVPNLPLPGEQQDPYHEPNGLFARAEKDTDIVKSNVSQITSDNMVTEPSRSTTESTYSGPSSTPRKIPNKGSGRFSEEEEHLLIFLKEVKMFKWTTITEEFNKDFPGRPYHTLQSRYSTKLNKRDRSLDPKILKLPPRWAAEAVTDWPTVHATTAVPRERMYLTNTQTEVTKPSVYAKRLFVHYQASEGDVSSSNESGPRQHRPRRAPPVNYDVRRRNRGAPHSAAEDDVFEEDLSRITNMNLITRSATPEEPEYIPETAIDVENEPLDVDFSRYDARLATASTRNTGTSEPQPYLSCIQRLAMRSPYHDWQWDQICSRQLQGAVIHVDFNSAELNIAKQSIWKVVRSPRRTRHTTHRRHFRALLEEVPDSTVKQISHNLRKHLPLRSSESIQAFLQDAQSGKLSLTPQVQRLSAARRPLETSSISKESTTSLLRQRELGTLSKRGWRTASKAITYQVKNKVMDTLGPTVSWTGASSDIHTVAWSPYGDAFVAGAVAVTDPDSMQYNRRNNLLYGDLLNNTIHELAEHSVKREKTGAGANSTHAMFVSQDPELYTTVTSVGFSPSGRYMYSAGYDKFVCIWNVETPGSQPALGARLRQSAKVDMMVVNGNYDGILATAAQKTDGSAVKLVKLNEYDLTNIQRQNFHSTKAVSRSDLNILPQALQFEPSEGRLLLAGFGANARADSGFDLTGDLCLWDIETQAQIPIHGSNRNVFDVTFNPNRRYMPLFAAGCVASTNVNRRTRSVIRLYDERDDTKYTCPLEIECEALDMNDVVWCPHDEHIIATGCTDGRVYVWDVRRPDEPLRTLSHGRSLMPLQDGVHHERTDTGVRFLSWGDNATHLYSGSSDGVVKAWDVTRSLEDTFIKDVVTFDSGVMAGGFSPDYTKLVIGEVNGSLTVLDVGKDDCSIKEAEQLRYNAYDSISDDDDQMKEGSITEGATPASNTEPGVRETLMLLRTHQLSVAPMGNLPIRQVVQGPNYQGPFDQSVDAPFLREQALEFQLSMATVQESQCDIASCKDNIAKVTSEEFGDSKRSNDRIPDTLRRQWIKLDGKANINPGRTKCSLCGRSARPPSAEDAVDALPLCERCSFSCLRCGSSNPISPPTTTLICDFCAGIWDIGALGYECTSQPLSTNFKLNVPPLRRFGREMLEQRTEDDDTSFGDEMNALTDHYFSLAIDRPESPPL